MSGLATVENRLTLIGERLLLPIHARFLVEALRSCANETGKDKEDIEKDLDAAFSSFPFVRQEEDSEEAEYEWRCECLREAMGIVASFGFLKPPAKLQYNQLKKLFLSREWKEYSDK